MVSNNSSIGQDLAAVASGAREVGQSLGLVAEDLIPGNPQEAAEAGQHVSKLGAAADRAGAGIHALEVGDWTGDAGEAFRANYLETSAPQWTTAADAFTGVGQALSEYARTLGDAQQRAASAQADLDQANAQSRAAAEAHNACVDAYNAEATAANAGGPAPSSGPPGAFTDPGAEARARAQQTLADAKAAVQAAGDRAAAVVQQAASRAPAQPGLISQALQGARDQFGTAMATYGQMAEGAGSAVAGMAEVAGGILKADFYAAGGFAVDPEGAKSMANGVASTVTAAASDPYATTKTVVGVDQWKSNPASAAGELIPNAVASVAGGGGIASKVATGAGKVGKAERASERVGEAAKNVEPPPKSGPSSAPPWHDPNWQPPTPSRPEHVPHEDPMPQLGDPPGDGAYHPDSDPKPTSLGERDHHMPPAEQGGLDDRAPNSDNRAPGPQPDPGTHSGLSPQREAALQQHLDRVDTMLERRRDTPDSQYEYMTAKDAQAQRAENMDLSRQREYLRERLGLPKEY